MDARQNLSDPLEVRCPPSKSVSKHAIPSSGQGPAGVGYGVEMGGVWVEMGGVWGGRGDECELGTEKESDGD